MNIDCNKAYYLLSLILYSMPYDCLKDHALNAKAI